MTASYEKVVMDRVWLVDAAGKVIKVPLNSLTEVDRLYVELYNPPRLDIEFHKKQDQLTGYYKGSIFLAEEIPPSVSEYSFKARVWTKDSKPYHHKLHVSYYAIGRQRLDRDKYLLLEKTERHLHSLGVRRNQTVRLKDPVAGLYTTGY